MKTCVVALLVVLGACSKKANDAAPAPGPVKPPEVVAKVIVGACTDAPIAENGGVLGVLRQGDNGEDIQGGLLGDEPGEMQGGFGIRGTGTSSGGSPYGSIGTGKYGTIGHGSGTGQGYGVGNGRGGMRGRQSHVPQVKIGTAETLGDLDKATIRRYIRQKMAQFEYCYAKQLLVNPDLAGTVTAQFVINPEGTVISSQASGLKGDRGDEVNSCVAQVIKAIQFPKPKGGGIVQVKYPFVFKVTGDDPPLTHKAPARTPLKVPSEEPENTLGEGKMGKPAKTSDAVLTAAAETLRASAPALAACYTKALARAPQLGGSVAALVIVDAQGAVTGSFASGVGDAEVENCLADAIRTVKFTAGAEARMSCALTLGAPAPPRLTARKEIPVVTITADDLTLVADDPRFDGKPLVKVAAVLADTSGDRIPELYEALRFLYVEALEHPTATREALRGVIQIRAARGTDAKVLNRVVQSALQAGYTAVALAVERSPGVYDALPGNPTVPVPRDARLVPPPGSPSTMISVLVTADDTWVGISTGDRRQVKDLAELPAILKEFKSDAIFENRADIEVAAEDQVPYEQVIKVMDMCVAAGFTEVGFMNPNALSVRFKQ